MEWLSAQAGWLSEWIETVVWVAIVAGLGYEGGRRMVGRARRVIGGVFTRGSRAAWGRLVRVSVAVAAIVLAPGLAAAGQGWWWGAPVNPGFDRNTVIQVTGTVAQVDIVTRGGPSTLRLETSGDSLTVMLGPGWYLAEVRADIRRGDALTVVGSKMMDRRGDLHLVAARITNGRTGTMLELRDEAGRPRWMTGHASPRVQP